MEKMCKHGTREDRCARCIVVTKSPRPEELFWTAALDRIAELEAENHELALRLNDQRTTAAALRKVASEAEAEVARLRKLFGMAERGGE